MFRAKQYLKVIFIYFNPLERFGNGIQLVGDQGKYALYDEKGNVLDKLPAIKALTTLINALSQPLDLSPALEQKTNAETGVVKVATGNTVANGNAEKMTVATPDEKIANDLVTVNIGSGVLVAGVKDDEPSEDFLRRIAERKQWQECLALDERRCGLNHMELVPALLNLSNAYLYLRRSQTRERDVERALKIEEHHYGENHVNVASTLTRLANAYGDLGDHNSKKKLLERALAIYEQNSAQLKPDYEGEATALVSLGKAYGDLGDKKRKIELIKRALEIREKYQGRDCDGMTMGL